MYNLSKDKKRKEKKFENKKFTKMKDNFPKETYIREKEALRFDKALGNMENKIDSILFFQKMRRQDDAYPFSFSKKDDIYIRCYFCINDENPLFYYPKGPVTDSLTLYSFAAKKVANYFLPKVKEPKTSNFFLDFIELIKDYSMELKDVKMEDLVIELHENISFTNEQNHSKFFPSSGKLFFTFVNPEELCEEDEKYKKYAYQTEKEFFQFKKGNNFNRSLILINLLQLQFYANNEKIKKSLPPQIKRLLICFPSTTNTRTKEEKIRGEGFEPSYAEIIVYDSSKTLEEIFIEHDWLFKSQPYKI